MKNILLIFAVGLLATLPVAGIAGDEVTEASTRIREKFPELDDASIVPTPIAGLYEVRVGAMVTYVTGDGGYLIEGQIIDVNSGVNLTEERRKTVRAEAVEQVGESSMIVFGPASAEHTVTVFTDIDCGYCRKLHREMADYNANDIRVRYMFFPRSGPETDSWEKADQVWCSEDRNTALTNAKAGKPVGLQSDDLEACGVTPVAQHYDLGRRFGIRGTPAIVLGSGEILPGYIPARELAAQLDSEQ